LTEIDDNGFKSNTAHVLNIAHP